MHGNMTSLQLIIFKENLIKFAMKEHTKNGGHRKDARKNHGERARGNLNKSDLHNPTELHCLCMEYSILTTLTIQPLPFFVSSLECSLFWYLRQIEQIK